MLLLILTLVVFTAACSTTRTPNVPNTTDNGTTNYDGTNNGTNYDGTNGINGTGTGTGTNGTGTGTGTNGWNTSTGGGINKNTNQ